MLPPRLRRVHQRALALIACGVALVAVVAAVLRRSGEESVEPAAVAAASAPPRADDRATVRLLLDGDEVATLGRKELERRPSLASMLPAGAEDEHDWVRLQASASDRRALDLADVGTHYRDVDVLLYWDEQHGPSIGLFRRVRPSLPAGARERLERPRVGLVGAAAIEVSTTVEPAVEAPPLELIVAVSGAAPLTFDEAALRALPESDPPGACGSRGGSRRMRGWHLRDVLRAPLGQRRAERILVRGAGRTIELDEAVLAAGGELVPILRRSPRGRLDLRLWRDGRETERLRGVERIDVVAR